MGLISRETKTGNITFGEFIEVTEFCKKHVDSNNCKSFHRSINAKCKFLECPYGMTVYQAEDESVFFSMRAKGLHKKERRNSKKEICYNPSLSEEKLLCLINMDCDLQKRVEKLESTNKTGKNIRHEINSLIGQIKEISDDLVQSFNTEEDEQYKLSQDEIMNLFNKIRTIFISSSMIMSRYTLDDYEKNPHLLSGSDKFTCTVYKKFDKVRKILKSNSKKRVQIELKGNSFRCIEAYSSFEFIPLLLIENAVKYSPKDGTVTILFEEMQDYNKQKLFVTISSYGPYCSEDEINRIFEKDYRGKNAIKQAEGSGIGLYFVKILCDLHNISVSARSKGSEITRISGVPYAPFEVLLEFNNIFCDSNTDRD